jgi:hypothetical protein
MSKEGLEPWVNAQEAGALLGISEASARALARRGKLQAYTRTILGVQKDRRYWFRLEDVMRRGKMIRPRIARKGTTMVKRATAAHYLGLDERGIERLVRAGNLVPKIDSKGNEWFQIRTLRELAEIPPEYLPIKRRKPRRSKPKAKPRRTRKATVQLELFGEGADSGTTE